MKKILALIVFILFTQGISIEFVMACRNQMILVFYILKQLILQSYQSIKSVPNAIPAKEYRITGTVTTAMAA